MNTQGNISNTSGRDLRNTSARADHNVQETRQEADQPINQEEANPDIQNQLAEAPGNMGEVDVLSIAQDPEESIKKRIKFAKLIQDDTQREAVYLSIVEDPEASVRKHLEAVKLFQYLYSDQDPEIFIKKSMVDEDLNAAELFQWVSYYRLRVAKLIQGSTQRDAVCLSIAENPKVDLDKRLRAAKLIQDNTQRDTVCLCITEELKEDTYYHWKFAKLIQGSTQRDAAYLSIAQNLKADIYYRLKAAELIQDATQRDAVYLSMAQNTREDIKKRLKAAKLIGDATQRDAAYLSIAQDPEIFIEECLLDEDLSSAESTQYFSRLRYRMDAAELIQDNTERDAAYLSIAQDPEIRTNRRLRAAKLIQDDTERDAVYLSIAQDPAIHTKYRLRAVELIQEGTQRDVAYLCMGQDPNVDVDARLKVVEFIIDRTIQEEICSAVVKDVFSSDNFRFDNEFIDEICNAQMNTQIKNLIIQAICQNWPLAAEEQFQDHLGAFRRLYELASNDAMRTELIMAIVIRTDLDAGFRKAVVEENEKDPEERERLVNVIEEKREGSFKGSSTKKAR